MKKISNLTNAPTPNLLHKKSRDDVSRPNCYFYGLNLLAQQADSMAKVIRMTTHSVIADSSITRIVT